MSLLKRFYYGCTDLIPLQLLMKISPANSLFPYHHIVSDDNVPHIKPLYDYKNTRQFTDDIEFLLKNFKPISPDKLIAYIDQHNRIPDRSFLLTFDDGFKEAADVIAPILKSKGVPAIFFINPAFIGNTKMFYRNRISLILDAVSKCSDTILLRRCAAIMEEHPENAALAAAIRKIKQDREHLVDELAAVFNISFSDYLAKNTPWLSLAQLKALASDGFTIGAHSWDHPYYGLIDESQQLEQTIHSCDFVLNQVGATTVTFSFPHSDTDVRQSFFDNLKKNNNEKPSLLFGTQNHKEELNNRMIHRFNAERPGMTMRKSTKGMLSYSILQALLNKQKLNRNYA